MNLIPSFGLVQCFRSTTRCIQYISTYRIFLRLVIYVGICKKKLPLNHCRNLISVHQPFMAQYTIH